MILLVGPPGSGKSTFCHQTVLSNIEMRPVIYVTTESAPSKIIDSLKQKGLCEVLPLPLRFVDAFHQTVGLPTAAHPDIVNASSENLTSLGIAILKLQREIGKKFLLVFDSLTSPYLMAGSEILGFIRKTLYRFAADGNAVLACMDEGCGKEEDLGAMMSTADGIVKIELRESTKTFNVIKHPKVRPTKIDAPMDWSPELSYHIDPDVYSQYIIMSTGFSDRKPLRTEVGDYVNLFWLNFIRWCGMLWDYKRFPTLTYNSGKDAGFFVGDSLGNRLPWSAKLYGKLFMPKDINEVGGMKKLTDKFIRRFHEGDRSSIIEYLDVASKTSEHYFRLDEKGDCWGFEGAGVSMCMGTSGSVAGLFKAVDKEHRDWNFVETKCIGLGDPYCVDKVVPGDIDEMKDILESLDNTILERIQSRLMDGLMGFAFRGEPLWKERPTLGNNVGLGQLWLMVLLPATVSEKYRVAIRLGGAMGGKKLGERLLDAGMKEDEAVKSILDLFEYCKVGKVSMGENLMMKQNCESFMVKTDEPSCHFTTGFLNGFFSAVKNQHVKETKCIAMGDPYCEWEFR